LRKKEKSFVLEKKKKKSFFCGYTKIDKKNIQEDLRDLDELM